MAARGLIQYYGLQQWWVGELTPEERASLEEVFHPLGDSNPRPLTEGSIERVGGDTATASGFLSALIGWVPAVPERALLRRKLRLKLAELTEAETNVIARHFSLQVLIGQCYRDRDSDPGCRDAAIQACREQIGLAPAVAAAMKASLFRTGLPRHVGFQQLAVILEKDREFEGAIALCKQARDAGWNGDWEKRIARCERRLGRAVLRRQSA
jgi:hypothetical protein